MLLNQRKVATLLVHLLVSQLCHLLPIYHVAAPSQITSLQSQPFPLQKQEKKFPGLLSGLYETSDAGKEHSLSCL